MRTNGVRCLLMGGQACVFYGAAEFSRDLDLVVLLDDANLDRLRGALAELQASSIAIPPLSRTSLQQGRAVHFRCAREDVLGLRIDVNPAPAVASPRAAVQAALRQDRIAVENALEAEEKAERAADRLHWEPLKRDLERRRRARWGEA
jgi:hypothetical protein